MNILKKIVGKSKNADDGQVGWNSDLEYLKKSPDRPRLSTIPELRNISVLADHNNQKCAISDEECKTRIHQEMAKQYNQYGTSNYISQYYKKSSKKQMQYSSTPSHKERVRFGHNITISNLSFCDDLSEDFPSKENQDAVVNQSTLSCISSVSNSPSFEVENAKTNIQKSPPEEIKHVLISSPLKEVTNSYCARNSAPPLSLGHKETIWRSLSSFISNDNHVDKIGLSSFLNQLSPLASRNKHQNSIASISDFGVSELFPHHDPASPKQNKNQNTEIPSFITSSLSTDIPVASENVDSSSTIFSNADNKIDTSLEPACHHEVLIMDEALKLLSNSTFEESIKKPTEKNSEIMPTEIPTNNPENVFEMEVQCATPKSNATNVDQEIQSQISESCQTSSPILATVYSQTLYCETIMHPLLKPIAQDLAAILHERGIRLLFDSYMEYCANRKQKLVSTALDYFKCAAILFDYVPSQIQYAEVLLQNSTLNLQEVEFNLVRSQIKDMLESILQRSEAIDHSIIIRTNTLLQIINREVQS